MLAKYNIHLKMMTPFLNEGEEIENSDAKCGLRRMDN